MIMPSLSVSSILPSEFPPSHDYEMFAGNRPNESMLAGKYPHQIPVGVDITRRTFLKSAGAAIITTSLSGTGRRNSTRSILPYEDLKLNEGAPEEVAITGQFTPYARHTMGINLCNRLGMVSYNFLRSNDALFNEFLIALRESKDPFELINSMNKLKVLLRQDIFEAGARKIEEANVSSALDPDGIRSIGVIDVLRSAMDPELMTSEILVAPQVLRFDPRRPKLTYIFTKARLTPLQRWEIVDGTPTLVQLPAEQREIHDALIVDCLAGSNMGFYSDLLQGAERHLGYHWEQNKGFFMLDENGGPSSNKINRLPMTQLSYDVD